MANYLLDTNHASPLVTLSHPLRKLVLQRLDAGDNFFICVPAITETLFGIGMLPRANQNLAEWERLKPVLPCYIPIETDAELAAELQRSLRRRGWQLETVDALIAVIALRYDLILLTTDKDFRGVPNLKHTSWLTDSLI
ncbi:MAG: type II toxin-antitoxin system VapC family toxin [Anaerolineales bacterium]|nr:type II toxin-antitoxin system VapC family toxin [Anaerolineales bacterium]